MFILGDKGHYYGLIPWVSVSLLVMNVVVFAAEVAIGDRFIYGYALIPEEITTFQDLTGPKSRTVWVQTNAHSDGSPARYERKTVSIPQYPGPVPICLTLLTSMFMHGSLIHLIANMWALIVFGRNVECAMGHLRFLAFYLGCGVIAGLAHVVSDLHSILPCVGASGAIAGVMGAYVAIYPLNKIKVWIGLPWIFEWPALIVIGAWAVMQYVSAMVADSQMGGVAYFAHLGGFFTGFIFVRIMVFFLRREKDASDAAKKASEAPSDAEPAPDPYAGFVTMQIIRRMKEEKRNRDNPAV